VDVKGEIGFVVRSDYIATRNGRHCWPIPFGGRPPPSAPCNGVDVRPAGCEGPQALLKPVVEAAERQRQRRVVIFEQEDDDESSMMGEPDLRAGRFGGQLEICACRGLHVARRVTFSRIY